MVHQYVVENFLLKVDAVMMDAQQNLDVLNLDAVLTYPDVVNLVHHRLDVVVDVELRHQLKMDCYRDVVVVELHFLLNRSMKMDCYQDVVLLASLLHH